MVVNTKINIGETLKTLLMFLLLLSFGSVFNIFFPFLYNFLFSGLSIFMLWRKRRIFVLRRDINFIILVLIITALSIIMTRSSISVYVPISLKLLFTISILFIFSFDYDDIAKHLIKAINIVVILAIVNFVLITFTPFLFVERIGNIGYKCNTFLSIFNYMPTAMRPLGSITVLRNQGVFWEPGILQIVANISVFYILIETKQPLKKAILPIVVILSTFSTSGVIILMGILLFKFKNLFTFKGKGFLYTLGMLVLISGFMPIFISEINYKLTNGAPSTAARLYDLTSSINAVSEHPFAGIGPNFDRYERYMTTETIIINDRKTTFESYRGNTNAVVGTIMFFGIPISFLIWLSIYRQQIFKNRLCFFMILFLALLSEPLFTTYFMYFIIVSSIKHNKIIYNR